MWYFDASPPILTDYMKNIRHASICLITIAILSARVFGESPSAQSEKNAATDRHEGICYFQHQILPTRTLNSNGRLFSDLATGIPAWLAKEAERIVDEEFAKALELKAYSEQDAYVIIFPEPDRANECYFSLLKKEADGFRYYVLEKRMNPFHIGESSNLYTWDKNGNQVNFGLRKYSDLKTFIDEVLYDKSPEA